MIIIIYTIIAMKSINMLMYLNYSYKYIMFHISNNVYAYLEIIRLNYTVFNEIICNKK
jgi:hypothetical protein